MRKKPCEAVKLMTIHASKGLEFPVVFVIGFSEGIFPSSKTIEERKKLGLEEERRLCYVAITRAMETLFIMDSEGLSQQGIKKLPSRFLYEIGEKNYQRIGKISDELERESWGYIRRLNQQMIEELPAPQSNSSQMIEHHIFGKGKVLSFDNKRKVYTVQFDGMKQPRAINAEYFSQTLNTSAIEAPVPVEPATFELVENPTQEQPNIFMRDKAEPEEDKDYEESEYQNLHPYYDEDDVETGEFQEEMPEREFDEDGGMEEGEEVEIEITEEPAETDFPADDEIPPDLQKISDELREKLANSPNHWNDPDFPKKGWTCTGVTDLGAPNGVCEMCGYQIIRYVHHMYHLESGRSLGCGCICAGKLEGDINKARRRETDFKNKQQRKINFKKKQWKRSARGHEYLKIKNHLVVIFHYKDSGKWNFALDNVFNKKAYNSREECLEAIFNALEDLLYN